MSTATAEKPRSKPAPAEAACDVPESPPPYAPPLAHVGETVLWYPDCDVNRDPRPAFVSEVHDRTLALHLPQTGTTEFRSDVRHVSDPKFRKQRNEDDLDMGAWDFTWQGKLLRKIAAEYGVEA